MFDRGKTGPKSVLTLEQQSALKLSLWNGVPHGFLAAQFGMKASYMPQVTSGRVLAAVPWPDGSTGPMAQYRKDQLALDRKRNTITQNTHGGIGPAAPGSIRSRMTEAEVNAMIADGENIIELARQNTLEEKRLKNLEISKRVIAKYGEDEEPKEVSDPEPFDPAKLARVDWQELLELHAEVPVFKLAEDDPILQDAICIAAAAEGHPKIDGELFMKVCAQIKRSLMEAIQ